MVKLIEDLRTEHDLIEGVAGSFRAFVDGARAEPADARGYVRFFRLFAGDYHHAREEDTLFVALADRPGLPAGTGPLAVLAGDHRRMAALLNRIEAVIDGGLSSEPSRVELRQRVRDYTEALLHHIDAENSVLLPESEARLRKSGVLELPGREPTGEEVSARDAGEALLRRYPAVHEPAIIRGDGCVLCPAMGEACAGLEREWWSESEWDELEAHLPSG